MNMGMVGIRGGDVVVVAPASSFHHHHHQINHDPISNSNTALGVGVIPLLTTAPCLPTMGIEDGDNNRNRNSGGGGGGGIQFWQNTQQSYLKKPTSMFDHTATSMNFLTGGVGVGVGGGGGTGGGVVVQTAAMTCQDCGNQAKKDCTHRRCRTCCKSRGFDCATHVKSTWVPAARRRERQLCTTTTAAAGSSGSSSAVKKPKLSQTTNSHTSTSNTTPPRSLDTSSSHQDASFKETLPRQVRAPAVFKCVRVTAIDDGEDEYAYQAVVKIGGHVFKGFLYDQGIEGREGFPNISDLHLGGGGNGGVNGRNGASSSSPVIDPSDVYAAASGGGLLGGAAAPPYGNPIN